MAARAAKIQEEVSASAVFEVAALAKALRLMASVADRKNSIPVLNNIRIAVADGRASLIATNLDFWMTQDIPAVEGHDFEVTVPAHLTSGIVSNFDGGAQATLKLNNGKAVLQSGRSRYTLPTIPADDFPMVAIGDGAVQFRVPASVLARVIGQLAFAIPASDPRPQLNGLFLHVRDGKLAFAATDGHRVGYVEIAMPAGSEGLQGSILPKRAVDILAKLVEDAQGDIEMTFDGKKAQFRMPNGTVFLTRVLDAVYPDYRKPYGVASDKAMEAEADLLDGALARLLLMADAKHREVVMKLEGGLAVLSAAQAESGDGMEEVPVAYDGPAFRIVFNAAYFRDNLAALKGQGIRMDMGDDRTAAIIRGGQDDGPLYVLAPRFG